MVNGDYPSVDPLDLILKQPQANRDCLILTEPEFSVLHQIIMREPEGVSELEAEDFEIVVLDLLREHGLIKKRGYRWHVTEAGVKHAMPKTKV